MLKDCGQFHLSILSALSIFPLLPFDEKVRRLSLSNNFELPNVHDSWKEQHIQSIEKEEWGRGRWGAKQILHGHSATRHTLDRSQSKQNKNWTAENGNRTVTSIIKTICS
jgi:hypothetical protein